MEDILSFKINHNVMKPGFYFLGEKNGVYTYDLRFKTPNAGDYLEPAAMHSIEHMIATVARNSDLKEQVVYFGPMGCRTGFYLLLFQVEPADALAFTKKCLAGAVKLAKVPGAEKKKCGNYLEHDYHGAVRAMYGYLQLLNSEGK